MQVELCSWRKGLGNLEPGILGREGWVRRGSGISILKGEARMNYIGFTPLVSAEVGVGGPNARYPRARGHLVCVGATQAERGMISEQKWYMGLLS